MLSLSAIRKSVSRSSKFALLVLLLIFYVAGNSHLESFHRVLHINSVLSLFPTPHHWRKTYVIAPFITATTNKAHWSIKSISLKNFRSREAGRLPGYPKFFKTRKNLFGWVKVRGTIDGYEIKKYHLMSMGDRMLFLAVRADIRKKINKKEGNLIHVVLYPDHEPLEVPEDMMLCIREEPKALKFFQSLSDGEQKFYMDWIYSTRNCSSPAFSFHFAWN